MVSSREGSQFMKIAVLFRFMHSLPSQGLPREIEMHAVGA